jgi:hypothetical protein
MYSEEFVRKLQKERGEYFNLLADARYQIKRAIAQLEEPATTQIHGLEIVESVIAQLRAYEESIK